MKYKVGTTWGNCTVIKNERIKNINFITMKCGYCNKIFTKKCSIISSALSRTNRLSCGCKTKEWKATQKRTNIQQYNTHGWELIKELKTKKYEQRVGMFLCPICKQEHKIKFANLKYTESCGCLKSKKLSEKLTNHLKQENKRLYRIFQGMKSRVNGLCKNSYLYKNKKVLFKDFEHFVTWSKENGYDETKEIHRINNGNYAPDECVWLTRQEHMKGHFKMHNKNLTKKKELFNMEMNKNNLSINAISKKYNMSYSKVKNIISFSE